MKIFNKCLKKQINTNYLLNIFNINNSTFNKINQISKTFARKIGRPNLNMGELNSENNNELNSDKITNSFQAPPKIKIENNPNDFEQSFSSQSFENDRGFRGNREFKQKKRSNDFNFDENQEGNNKPRESFGERENRGFKYDREFRNKRFEENEKGNFNEKRSFNREQNFESGLLVKLNYICLFY